MKNKWIKKDGAGLVRAVDQAPSDVTATQLRSILEADGAFNALPEKDAQVLKKRQLITQVGHSKPFIGHCGGGWSPGMVMMICYR